MVHYVPVTIKIKFKKSWHINCIFFYKIFTDFYMINNKLVLSYRVDAIYYLFSEMQFILASKWYATIGPFTPSVQSLAERWRTISRYPRPQTNQSLGTYYNDYKRPMFNMIPLRRRSSDPMDAEPGGLKWSDLICSDPRDQDQISTDQQIMPDHDLDQIRQIILGHQKSNPKKWKIIF